MIATGPRATAAQAAPLGSEYRCRTRVTWDAVAVAVSREPDEQPRLAGTTISRPPATTRARGMACWPEPGPEPEQPVSRAATTPAAATSAVIAVRPIPVKRMTAAPGCPERPSRCAGLPGRHAQARAPALGHGGGSSQAAAAAEGLVEGAEQAVDHHPDDEDHDHDRDHAHHVGLVLVGLQQNADGRQVRHGDQEFTGQQAMPGERPALLEPGHERWQRGREDQAAVQ